MVSVQESRNKHAAIYLGSGRPKANSPTRACLDRCHHGGELKVVFLARNPEGWRLEVGDEQILPWGDHLSSPPPTLVSSLELVLLGEFYSSLSCSVFRSGLSPSSLGCLGPPFIGKGGVLEQP